MVLKDGQLQSGGAMEERKSKTQIDEPLLCYRLLPLQKATKAALVDSCKSGSVLLVSPLVAFMF